MLELAGQRGFRECARHRVSAPGSSRDVGGTGFARGVPFMERWHLAGPSGREQRLEKSRGPAGRQRSIKPGRRVRRSGKLTTHWCKTAYPQLHFWDRSRKGGCSGHGTGAMAVKRGSLEAGVKSCATSGNCAPCSLGLRRSQSPPRLNWRRTARMNRAASVEVSTNSAYASSRPKRVAGS